MNRCYHITDPETGEKVFIPGCMGRAALNYDKCICWSQSRPKKFKMETIDGYRLEKRKMELHDIWDFYEGDRHAGFICRNGYSEDGLHEYLIQPGNPSWVSEDDMIAATFFIDQIRNQTEEQ